MLLTSLVAHYAAHHPYGISNNSLEQLTWAVAGWSTYLGRDARVSDFTTEEVNLYLDWLLANRAPDTVRTRRGSLLLLWNYAYEEELVPHAPRNIRKLRPIQRSPEAWTTDEIRALFDAASDITGTFRGTDWNRAVWTESILRAGYDTALRLGDLLSIRTDQIGPTIHLVQSKTRRRITVALRPRTLAAIDQCVADHGKRLVWPLWSSRDAFYRHISKLVRLAGVRPGTFKWIRRAAVTALEKDQPGMGTRLAGHAHRHTTELWYIDRAQTDEPILPPL